MSRHDDLRRRDFLGGALTTAGAGMLAGLGGCRGGADAGSGPSPAPAAVPAMPCGTIGKARISRLLLGGNLLGGFMHARDLKYVGSLFRAYCTEAKILETLALAEQHGINTVFEIGGEFVEKYNRTRGGRMQFIPHIVVEPEARQSEAALKDHIRKQAESGAVALYVWGVSSDRLMRAQAIDRIAMAVELAKAHDLPVGVGSHSLLVPMECEKLGVPCDFYVKTLHPDTYFSATPKPLRKEFIWLTGGEGWQDNMWCINPEETVAFMQTVCKPWIAFKVLAAGAFLPQEGFGYAIRSGADFLAVGMFDFQIPSDCETFRETVQRYRIRERPWHG
jgi:hypothetical protein